MKHKKFEMIMMKNTLAMMLPIMALLLVLIFVGVRYSLFNVVQCYEITDVEPASDQIEKLYENNMTSVRYDAVNLYYTGYDYLVENKIRGAYYYCFEDDHMLFFLISTKAPENIIDQYLKNIIVNTCIFLHVFLMTVSNFRILTLLTAD